MQTPNEVGSCEICAELKGGWRDDTTEEAIESTGKEADLGGWQAAADSRARLAAKY